MMNQPTIKLRERNPSLHKGHRERLRNKVRTAGIKCLSTHEVLELLLTFARPRVDVNEIAHDCIATFGSIKNTLKANPNDLEKIRGISKETSFYLNYLADVIDLLKDTKKSSPINLGLPNQCHKFFVETIGVKDVEEIYLLFVDEKYNLIKSTLLATGDFHQIVMKKEELADALIAGGSGYFILVHTHPHGNIDPSHEDTKATKTFIGLASLSHKVMLDHIIINQSEYFSFKHEKDLDGMTREVQKLLNNMFASIKY